MASIGGKVVLVTGAADGIGPALTVALAQAGAVVLVHGDDPGRLEDTVRVLGAAVPGAVMRSHCADFSSLEEVRRLAAEVAAAERRLDVLVNNAGIGATVPGGGARQESADGHELRFAVNYLARYALTRLLLPLLWKAAPSRVVNVSPPGQQAINFGDVMLTAGYDGGRACRQSRLAQVMNTFDLAAELSLAGITVNALAAEGDAGTSAAAAVMRLIVTSAGVIGTGRLFAGNRAVRADEQAYDEDARRQLRELSGKLTGI
ncbi:MAG TPA: SDR family NAD(P)-dependent oxidoreductase [Trebonia sp.]|jgi:NAD(P)-dependent dehydrogenase (short-subunit alcohol dehydrogenase family)